MTIEDQRIKAAIFRAAVESGRFKVSIEEADKTNPLIAAILEGDQQLQELMAKPRIAPIAPKNMATLKEHLTKLDDPKEKP